MKVIDSPGYTVVATTSVRLREGARTVTVLLPPVVPSLALTTITYEPELTRAAGMVTAALLPLATVVMVLPDHVHAFVV